MSKKIRQKLRGQILVMMTLFVGFLMGFSALAFDLAYAMVIRAELITALDAAALAAIRFVPDGEDARGSGRLGRHRRTSQRPRMEIDSRSRTYY